MSIQQIERHKSSLSGREFGWNYLRPDYAGHSRPPHIADLLLQTDLAAAFLLADYAANETENVEVRDSMARTNFYIASIEMRTPNGGVLPRLPPINPRFTAERPGCYTPNDYQPLPAAGVAHWAGWEAAPEGYFRPTSNPARVATPAQMRALALRWVPIQGIEAAGGEIDHEAWDRAYPYCDFDINAIFNADAAR